MTDEAYEFIQDCKDKKITARSARSTRTHCGKSGAVRLPSDFMTKKEREAMNGECKSYRMNEPITWAEFKTWPDEHKVSYIKLLRHKFNVPNANIAEMMGVDRVHFNKVVINPLGLMRGKKGVSRTWDREGFLAWCSGAKDGAVKKSEVDICEDDELVVVNEEPEIVIGEQAAENALSDAIDKESAERIEKLCQKVMDMIHEDYGTEENSVHDVTTDDIYKMAKNEPGYMERDDLLNALSGSTKSKTICTNPYHIMPVIPKSGTMSFEHDNADDALNTIRALLSNAKVNLTVSWEAVFTNDICKEN